MVSIFPALHLCTDGKFRAIISLCITRTMLGLCPDNVRRRYKVTPSLIGWVLTWNQPCMTKDWLEWLVNTCVKCANCLTSTTPDNISNAILHLVNLANYQLLLCHCSYGVIWKATIYCGKSLWCFDLKSNDIIPNRKERTVSQHVNHDDVIKWKLFPRYWPYVRGHHQSLMNSPHKGPVTRTFMFLCWGTA